MYLTLVLLYVCITCLNSRLHVLKVFWIYNVSVLRIIYLTMCHQLFLADIRNEWMQNLEWMDVHLLCKEHVIQALTWMDLRGWMELYYKTCVLIQLPIQIPITQGALGLVHLVVLQMLYTQMHFMGVFLTYRPIFTPLLTAASQPRGFHTQGNNTLIDANIHLRFVLSFEF